MRGGNVKVKERIFKAIALTLVVMFLSFVIYVLTCLFVLPPLEDYLILGNNEDVDIVVTLDTPVASILEASEIALEYSKDWDKRCILGAVELSYSDKEAILNNDCKYYVNCGFYESYIQYYPAPIAILLQEGGRITADTRTEIVGGKTLTFSAVATYILTNTIEGEITLTENFIRAEQVPGILDLLAEQHPFNWREEGDYFVRFEHAWVCEKDVWWVSLRQKDGPKRIYLHYNAATGELSGFREVYQPGA